METSSFRELDGGWRERLAWLHDDYFYRRQVLPTSFNLSLFQFPPVDPACPPSLVEHCLL